MRLDTLLSMDPRYLLEQNAPDIDDYLRLRADTGLSTKTTEQAKPIFDSSWLWM